METGCGLNVDQDLSRQLLRSHWAWNGDQECWERDTPHGPAQLVELVERASWRHFELRGGALSLPAPRRLFAENFRLNGPLKYQAVGRKMACIADVPCGATDCELTAGFVNPWSAWSQCITHHACGASIDAGFESEIPLDEFLRGIQSAGWSASIDDGRLLVHLQLPGAYRQLRMELCAEGTRLVVDLLDWSGASRLSLRAMTRLAQAANARLPLVRLAVDEHNQPTVLRAEVHLGRLPILGAWMNSAVEVLATAVALLAREIEALRDPELAQVVLAASAA